VGVPLDTRSLTVREAVAVVLPAAVAAANGALRLVGEPFALGRDDLYAAIETGDIQVTEVGDSPDDWLLSLDSFLPWLTGLRDEWRVAQRDVQ
jgi:hypothetical protein